MTIVAPTESGHWLDEYDAPRFWSRVNFHGGTEYESDPLATAEGECWIWTGAINGSGYGWFRLFGKVHRPHRVAFVDCGGVIPEGEELDHLCRRRACLRPSHLEPVTHKVNMERARRDHCSKGHEYTPENTRIDHRPTGDIRLCKTCRRDYVRGLKARRRATT